MSKNKITLTCDTFERTTFLIESREDGGLFIEVNDSNTDRLPTLVGLNAEKKEQLLQFLLETKKR